MTIASQDPYTMYYPHEFINQSTNITKIHVPTCIYSTTSGRTGKTPARLLRSTETFGNRTAPALVHIHHRVTPYDYMYSTLHQNTDVPPAPARHYSDLAPILLHSIGLGRNLSFCCRSPICTLPLRTRRLHISARVPIYRSWKIFPPNPNP